LSPLAPPALQLSLQQPDASLRQVLTRSRARRWLQLALHGRPAEITVRVVGEDEGLRLNQGFRRQDHATNVLTFDYAREPLVQADIVLCAPVVLREAAQMGVAVQDHLAHLLVHGALHALGHDHIRAAEARRMEALETRLLATLGVADPYRRRDEPR
jgi:probable rRNA maturation factor